MARDIAFALGKGRLVLLRLHHRQQLGRLLQSGVDLVEFGDRRFQFGAFAPERLRLGRLVPDRRIAELVVQLLEPLALLVVLKDTP